MKIELKPDQPPEQLDAFLSSLETQLERDQDLERVSLEAKRNHKNWDPRAKPVMGEIVRTVAKQAYGTDEGVWIEGADRKKKFRVMMAEVRKPDYTLFGSRIWPDMALFKPYEVAIELDHSGSRSHAGAALKMALAKSSNQWLSGLWQNCVEIFYNQTREDLLIGEREKSILHFYEEKCHTFCIVIR